MQLSSPAPKPPFLKFVLLQLAWPTVHIAKLLLHIRCNEHIMSVTQGQEDPSQC